MEPITILWRYNKILLTLKRGFRGSIRSDFDKISQMSMDFHGDNFF